jgi:hypothetical protein
VVERLEVPLRSLADLAFDDVVVLGKPVGDRLMRQVREMGCGLLQLLRPLRELRLDRLEFGRERSSVLDDVRSPLRRGLPDGLGGAVVLGTQAFDVRKHLSVSRVELDDPVESLYAAASLVGGAHLIEVITKMPEIDHEGV